MAKCDFNKVALQGCSLVNFLHIFRAPFPKNISHIRPGRFFPEFLPVSASVTVWSWKSFFFYRGVAIWKRRIWIFKFRARYFLRLCSLRFSAVPFNEILKFLLTIILQGSLVRCVNNSSRKRLCKLITRSLFILNKSPKILFSWLCK